MSNKIMEDILILFMCNLQAHNISIIDRKYEIVQSCSLPHETLNPTLEIYYFAPGQEQNKIIRLL